MCDKRCCFSCIYWTSNKWTRRDRLDSSVTLNGIGKCHRYPPPVNRKYIGEQSYSEFPITFNYFWCGEWKELTDEFI